MNKHFQFVDDAMHNCYQTPGQTIWQHGLAVYLEYADLYLSLLYQRGTGKHPNWINHPKIRRGAHYPSIMRPYMLYHDMGKPFCVTIDDEGKQHFPNHAEVSYQMWNFLTKPTPDNLLIGELIRNDMFFHITKPGDGEAIKDMAKKPYANTLLIAAYCEIQANANMFGGKSSDSYKIKMKRLNQLAKKLIGELP